MPLQYHQLNPQNNNLPGYAVAQELARQTVAQFGAVRWVGVGIAGGSCCAALAVNPNQEANYPAAYPVNGFGAAPGAGAFPQPIFGLIPLPYSIAYGNSQLMGGGLAIVTGGHAERAALNAANQAGLQLYNILPGNHAVLFVELTPCQACQNWLGGGGAAVPNPYNNIINNVGANTTLHVWWRFPYVDGGQAQLPPNMGLVNPAPGPWPGGTGVPAMQAFHGMALPAQLAEVNNW